MRGMDGRRGYPLPYPAAFTIESARSCGPTARAAAHRFDQKRRNLGFGECERGHAESNEQTHFLCGYSLPVCKANRDALAEKRHS
jgi:hypothetical protein